MTRADWEHVLFRVVVVLLAIGTYVAIRWGLIVGGWHADDQTATGAAVVAALMIWARYLR